MSVMKCERSVITMTLHWHSSQVSSLGNCVDHPPTETSLRRVAITTGCLKKTKML